jgi:hypothetical protein
MGFAVTTTGGRVRVQDKTATRRRDMGGVSKREKDELFFFNKLVAERAVG